RFEKRTISSRELENKSEHLAMALINLGISKGDRIVTVLPPTPEYAILLVAASKIGAILVPMDVRYRHTDFIRLIPQIEPMLIVSILGDDQVNFQQLLKQLIDEDLLSQYVRLLFLGFSSLGDNYYDLYDTEYDLHKELVEKKNRLTKDNDLLIIWTGGTTGFPKAAILTNSNVVEMCIVENDVLKDGLELRESTGRTKLLANLPVSHVGGSVELIGVGIVGGYELIIHNRWSSTKTLEAIQQEKISVMLAAPTMYRIMMTHERFDSFDLSSLKLTMISGEVVNQEFIDLMQEKFCDTIINGYGSTEIGPEVTFTHPDDDYSTIANGYVGKPLPGVILRIADFDEKELASNQVGEVLVKGNLVCNGYFRNPDENQLGFTEDGWFKTGDLGKLDDTGGLWLQGRIKDIIRVGSYTVLPMEIEELVLQNYMLEFAAAISIPDDILGEVVWLVVTPKNNEKISEDELIDLCKRELADYKVPRKVILYDIDPANPPMTRIGKIDKNRLRDELLAD
ncbi:MAG: class I adenylate-forming enzyme family protein, partial [Candidatus Kariarchaeaceae archaeon]